MNEEKEKDEEKKKDHMVDLMKTVYQEQMKLHPEIYNKKDGEQQ